MNHATAIAETCDFCQLPLGGSKPSPGAKYCCFGCRFAADVTRDRGAAGESHWTAATLGLSVFLSMNVIMLTMALWSYASIDGSDFERTLAEFLRYGAMAFAAPVWLLLGRPLVQHAWSQWQRGVLSTDLLLLTGVSAANVASIVATVRGTGHVYFEVGCTILVLVTLGRWLEARCRWQATQALDELERLIPNELCIVDAAGHETMVPHAQVEVGQIVRVRAGDRIPVDGHVCRGRGVVDEQFFTGESVPVEKQLDDTVLGGSLNLEGDLQVQVAAPPFAGALGRLVEAVRAARQTRGRYHLLADRWSSAFFPLVFAAALATLLWHAPRVGWEPALLHALAVVLIACPCGLALATPLAQTIALGTAARRGVLFRGGNALESLSELKALCWDKTGTLTTGHPTFQRLIVEDFNEQEFIESLTIALAAASRHPLSLALLAALRPAYAHVTSTIEGHSFESYTTRAGRGVVGQHWMLGEVLLGSPRWLAEEGLATGPQIQAILQGETAHEVAYVAIGWKGQTRGLFLLEETLRSEAANAIAECYRLGLKQTVLTGDHRARGQALAESLRVPVVAELLPEQKLDRLREMARTYGPVAMVGDGLNDAPALAAAAVGIAMGCGADVTRDSADVCLVTNDLRRMPWAIALSRRTVGVIRCNLAWSFGYNSLGVLVAMTGQLHPALAAVLMVVSSIVVVNQSMSLAEDDEVAKPLEPIPLAAVPYDAFAQKVGV